MTFWMAGTGPIPISAGATPAAALEPTKASTSIPKDFARSASIKINAAAPSLTPEALPAVTEPDGSVVNAGRSLARASAVVDGRGCSSMSTRSGSPLRWGTETGTNSSANRPRSWAEAHRCWLCKANWSWASRLMPYFWATVSAVMPKGSVCPISSILGCTNLQPIEVSYISCDRPKAAFDFETTYGARLIDSTPPARYTSP